MPTHKTMRVTGGTLVRRRFTLPALVDEGLVRPTPDRVREAVFSMIRDELVDANVLDIFAGSGAHGYEAISRGAKSVIFIEKDPRVARVIQSNISLLNIADYARVIVADALNYVTCAPSQRADIIFVDPPYTIKPDQQFFAALEQHVIVGGIVIFRCFKKEEPAISENFVIEKDRSYAGTRVFVLRYALTPKASQTNEIP